MIRITEEDEMHILETRAQLENDESLIDEDLDSLAYDCQFPEEIIDCSEYQFVSRLGWG